MNLNTLHDAFTTLEERADVARAEPPDFTVSVRPARPGLTRFAAPVAAAAAVVSVAAGVTVWQSGQHSGHVGQAATQGASSSAPPSSAPSSVPPAHPGRYQPPDTVAKLAAKTRAILGGLATITVDQSRSSNCGSTTLSLPAGPPSSLEIPAGSVVPLPGGRGNCSGASLVGTLTSNGRTGGFTLDVFATSPGSKAQCAENGGPCSVDARSDGSTLAVGTWNDPAGPGGVIHQVELVRPDGADILIDLSPQDETNGRGAATTSQLPLTTQQLTALVTSTQW
jgi:hypothetical protein